MGKHRKKRKRPQGPTAAHVGMGGQHMGVGVGVGVMPQQAPQLQMPNPGMLAQSMKAEFSDIGELGTCSFVFLCTLSVSDQLVECSSPVHCFVFFIQWIS